MSGSTEAAKVALALALLIAVGPAREQSPSPPCGIRAALELIDKQPGRATQRQQVR